MRRYEIGLNHGPGVKRIPERTLKSRYESSNGDNPEYTHDHARRVERSRAQGMNRCIEQFVAMGDGTIAGSIAVIGKYDGTTPTRDGPLVRMFKDACERV